jgi:hypothetical protein
MKTLLTLTLFLCSCSCKRTPEEIEQDNIRRQQQAERCKPPGKEVGKTVWSQDDGGSTLYSFENGEIWEYDSFIPCWTKIK